MAASALKIGLIRPMPSEATPSTGFGPDSLIRRALARLFVLARLSARPNALHVDARRQTMSALSSMTMDGVKRVPAARPERSAKLGRQGREHLVA